MVGILYYFLFLIIGFFYADLYFKDKDLYFRIWSGGLIGNLGLMAGIVPFAFLLDFTVLSHGLLLVVFAAPRAYLLFRRRDFGARLRSLGRREETPAVTHAVFIGLILPAAAVIWILLTNHIMAPYAGGGIASGQSTYGDLAMHMGFVTSIAEQQQFPPMYNQLAGVRLNYPFLIDSLSSSLYLLGTGLRTALLVPSYVFALLLVMGFYYLAYTLTGKRKAAVLASVLFFLCGGFGFAYFFEGAKEDPSQFTRIFTEYYQTPTNYNDENIRWSNTICDMIIPQRTTMAGWTVLLFALWLLIDGLRTRQCSRFWLLGVVAGCMPMIHTHSFLALGVLSAVLLPLSLIGCKEKKSLFLCWLRYGGVALALALPQLFFWTFSQAQGGSGFLIPQFNWVNEQDPYLWFWLKNCGLICLLVLPAAFAAQRENRLLMIAAGVLFLLAELVLFQPNAYDNNKLFYVVYMLAVIVVSDYLLLLYDKLKGVRGRAFLAVLVIAAGTLSGLLTIGREYQSGAEYQTFSDGQIAFAEFVKEETPPDATFATSGDHLNPVSVLAGRNVFAGSELYVYFHGLGTELSRREAIIERLYTSASTNSLRSLAQENGIDYILLSAAETRAYDVNQTALSGLELIYDKNNIRLYRI